MTQRDTLEKFNFGKLNASAVACFESSYAAGWWDIPEDREEFLTWDSFRDETTPTKIALIHSEVSEAMEAFRKNADDDHLPHRKGFEVELADAIIRIFDLAGAHNLDLQGAIQEKMAYNAQRADHKLENRAAEGGKKF